MKNVRAFLFTIVFCGTGCHSSGTFVVLQLSSATPIAATNFAVDLTNNGLHATATFDKTVTLPPTQELSLQLNGNPTGVVEVVVHANDTSGEIAMTQGQITIVPHGTTTLPLSFTADVGDAGVGDGATGTDGAAPNDLTTVQAVSFDVTPSLTTVNEHQSFSLHIVAKKASGQPETEYVGTVTLTSSWGDVTPTAQPVFVAGVSDIAVSLNRETHAGFAGAFITAADGAAMGKSPEITVGVAAWEVDGSKVRVNATYMKSGMTLAETVHPGAVTAVTGGGYKLIVDQTVHMGLPAATPSFGIWSSPDGMDWTSGAGMLGSGNSSAGVSSTSILWDGTQYRALFTGSDGTTNYLLGATSPTAVGATWTAETPVTSSDFFCGTATNAMLYGMGSYHRVQGGVPICTIDGTGLATRYTGLTTTGTPWAGYVQEGTVSKVWAISGTTTLYFTAGDGITWVQSATAIPMVIYAVYWNNERKQLEALTDPSNIFSYYRTFRP